MKILFLGLVALISLVVSTITSTAILKTTEKETPKTEIKKQNKTNQSNTKKNNLNQSQSKILTGPGNIDVPYQYSPPTPRQIGPGNL